MIRSVEHRSQRCGQDQLLRPGRGVGIGRGILRLQRCQLLAHLWFVGQTHFSGIEWVVKIERDVRPRSQRLEEALVDEDRIDGVRSVASTLIEVGIEVLPSEPEGIVCVHRLVDPHDLHRRASLYIRATGTQVAFVETTQRKRAAQLDSIAVCHRPRRHHRVLWSRWAATAQDAHVSARALTPDSAREHGLRPRVGNSYVLFHLRDARRVAEQGAGCGCGALNTGQRPAEGSVGGGLEGQTGRLGWRLVELVAQRGLASRPRIQRSESGRRSRHDGDGEQGDGCTPTPPSRSKAESRLGHGSRPFGTRCGVIAADGRTLPFDCALVCCVASRSQRGRAQPRRNG